MVRGYVRGYEGMRALVRGYEGTRVRGYEGTRVRGYEGTRVLVLGYEGINSGGGTRVLVHGGISWVTKVVVPCTRVFEPGCRATRVLVPGISYTLIAWVLTPVPRN